LYANTLFEADSKNCSNWGSFFYIQILRFLEHQIQISTRAWPGFCSYSSYTIKIIAGERHLVLAEGATTPETLRQKDRNNSKIWREARAVLTEGDGWAEHQFNRSSQVP